MVTASIIIPTKDRPHLLPRAVASALAQSVDGGVEVIVVDDGSARPPDLPPAPGLKLIVCDPPVGSSRARNLGLEAARGRWALFLDDDDELRPGMLARALAAAAAAKLPPPVGVLCGIEVVGPDGMVREIRRPPTLPRGSAFHLAPPQPGRSLLTKQTLVAERSVLLDIGGFDPSFRSRVHTDLFLRLNPVCSLLGLPEAGYRLHRHGEERISTNRALRIASFDQLIRKHAALLEAHPHGFARMLRAHARTCWDLGERRAAVAALAQALGKAPGPTLRWLRRRGFDTAPVASGPG